jgi:hypothetical protein
MLKNYLMVCNTNTYFISGLVLILNFEIKHSLFSTNFNAQCTMRFDLLSHHRYIHWKKGIPCVYLQKDDPTTPALLFFPSHTLFMVSLTISWTPANISPSPFTYYFSVVFLSLTVDFTMHLPSCTAVVLNPTFFGKIYIVSLFVTVVSDYASVSQKSCMFCFKLKWKSSNLFHLIMNAQLPLYQAWMCQILSNFTFFNIHYCILDVFVICYCWIAN